MKLLFLLSILFLLFYVYDREPMDNDRLYEKLMGIFNNKNYLPTGNRNSAGGQYFKYILNELNPTIDEFTKHHKMYCAVSGSPIDHKRKDNKDFIVLKDMNNQNICGYYYRCCTPCNCDLMRENNTVRVNEETIKGEKFYVISIEDPCKNPEKIQKGIDAFICENDETMNGIVENGRLKIGILHDAKICSPEDLESIENHPNTGKNCSERNRIEADNLKGGMGDLFVKLTIDNNLTSNINSNSIL